MARQKAANPREGSEEDKIIIEAKKRFNRVEMWESVARKRWLDDVKFCNGDSDNMYQWPWVTSRARGYGTAEERPCLTINKTRQHCLQIINDSRQNKTSIKIKPTGNEATYEAAQVLEGIVRHIEYVSDAQSAYGTATRHQVQGGIGYWRVVTDYAGDDSFDQEVFIRRIKDPMTVYVDPDIQTADGSDMRWAFIFDDMPKDEFDAAYPQYKGKAASALGDNSLIPEDHVRVAEYFRCVEKSDRLVVLRDPDSGEELVVRASDVPEGLKEAFDKVVDDPRAKMRTIKYNQVEWFLIVGDRIAERRDWPGRYIPIVRVPGEETVIDGELDRKGHVRALKDPQRMYNYNASSQVESVALQSKIPYIAPAQAIEGLENYWESANVHNWPVLPYNHKDDNGQPLNPPQRAQPPVASSGFEVGMRNAAQDMMLVSGQYEAMVGAQGNERSGVAIQQRQRQGDNATYHFIDHLSMAIRFTGKIILDLIPKVYDTKRIIHIMAEDGTTTEVTLDPQAAQAYFKTQEQVGETAREVTFNPNVGRYEVMSDVGPAFATRRQEAFNAFTQIVSQDSQLMPIIGDLMFKAADFPFADEIAERLERMVPAQAKGEGPNPELQGLQAQIQMRDAMIQAMSQKLQDAQIRTEDDALQKLIDMFKAETDRLKVLLDNAPDPNLLAEQEHEVNMLDRQTVGQMMLASHTASLEPPPEPMPQPQMAQ